MKASTRILPDMQIVVTPTLEDWLQKGDTEQYPYTKEHDKAKMEPFVVLHTSGSTGLSFITFSINPGSRECEDSIGKLARLYRLMYHSKLPVYFVEQYPFFYPKS
jgi:hypothetical protein